MIRAKYNKVFLKRDGDLGMSYWSRLLFPKLENGAQKAAHMCESKLYELSEG